MSRETPRHSPGPWQWANRDQLTGPAHEPVLQGHVFYLWSEPHAGLAVTAADAALIAAAPALLAVLEDALALVSALSIPDFVTSGIWDDARAAIAQATGRPDGAP